MGRKASAAACESPHAAVGDIGSQDRQSLCLKYYRPFRRAGINAADHAPCTAIFDRGLADHYKWPCATSHRREARQVLAKESDATILTIDGREVAVTHPDKAYFTKAVKLSKLDIVR